MGDQQHEVEVSGRVVRLEVENFKSYRGFQNIGPFKNFTAVVGPNGSGKSNLMDAISFVLGVKTAQLRGSLKELLYSNSAGQSADDRPRKGFVKLVYASADGEETHFSRIIAPSSSSADATFQSQYKLNSKIVSWEGYNNQLKMYNILVKARNFLVFQGDIESYAAMSPKELTDRFEHISGSETHRKQYHELESQKLKAEEQTSFLFSKRKTVTQEKKQKKEQKEEAEKHVKMQQELEQLKSTYFLWQLFHIDHDLTKARQRMAKESKALETAARSAILAEKEIDAKKKEQAGYHLERIKLERHLKRRRTESDQKNPEVVALKEDIKRTSKKLKLWERELEDRKTKLADQHSKVAKLEQDHEQVNAAQSQLEQEMQEQQAQGGLLHGEQMAEFSRLEAQANAKTSRTKTALDTLATTQQADKETLQELQRDSDAMQERLQQLEKDKERTQRHHDELVIAINAGKEELREKRKERGGAADANRKAGAQRDFLQSKIFEKEGTLADAKADRKESERDRKIHEAIANLKRLFPGVHGQVTELTKVSQKKYAMAVTVALGKEMDSVVVDNDKTAKECIRYLTEQRIQPLTFIPLSSVKAQPTNDRLRQLGGSAKLVIDLLQYEPHLDRAFRYVCGNILVCDSTEEAKQLSWGQGGERHKVATLEGTLFAKAGTITGGMAGNLLGRSQRWGDKEYETLKKEVADHQRCLEALPSERECRQEEERLTAEIQGLEKACQYREVDMKATLEKQNKIDDEISALNSEAQQRNPRLAELTAAIKKRQEKMTAMEEQINAVKDATYASFSKQMGVSSVREHMDSLVSKAERFNKRKQALQSQGSKLKQAVAYERSSDASKKVQEQEGEVAALRAKLQKLEKQEAAGRQARQDQEADLEERTQEVQELQRQAQDVETQIRELKKSASKQQQQGAAIKRSVTSEQAAVDALLTRQADLLSAAAMEQIQLPQADEQDSEEMDTEEQAGASGVQVQLDYSSLSREHKAAGEGRERDKLAAQFQADIEERSALLAKLVPNLKAVEQYEAVKERERDSMEELEAAKQQAQAATHAFSAVRQARYDTFMQAFNHISAGIDKIFKDLTKSSVHPMGGQAYLSLENNEDPFLHGIKFTAMPPSKRFREMEQLSGGEKTVAALALLFAIHTYQPSPFFVLDEIDAALDASNVARVANYIREKTRDSAQGAFQSIVISLKDNFFEKADALVGVCRDSDLGCSATLTFDLNRFVG
ncbi:hypothetical protein ABBQ32_001975 [Trebouxia sp. C0010 RCD-2024]